MIFLDATFIRKNQLEAVPVDMLKKLPLKAEVDLSLNDIVTGDFYAMLALKRYIDLLGKHHSTLWYEAIYYFLM